MYCFNLFGINQIAQKLIFRGSRFLGVSMLRGQMQESRGSALFFYFGQPANERPRILWAHLPIVLPFDRWDIGRRHVKRAFGWQNLGATEAVWRLLLTWIYLRELESVQFGHVQKDTDLGMQALLFPSNQPCVLPDQLARHPVSRRTLQSGKDLMEINSSLIPLTTKTKPIQTKKRFD